MNWPWPPPRGRDVASIFAIIVIAGAMVFIFARYPQVGGLRPNTSFGPDWNCVYPGQGDPVCTRKLPANPARTSDTP